MQAIDKIRGGAKKVRMVLATNCTDMKLKKLCFCARENETEARLRRGNEICPGF